MRYIQNLLNSTVTSRFFFFLKIVILIEGLGATTRKVHFLSKMSFSWNIVHGRNIYILVEKSEKSVYSMNNFKKWTRLVVAPSPSIVIPYL